MPIEVSPAPDMHVYADDEVVPVYTVRDSKRKCTFVFDEVVFQDDRPWHERTVVSVYKCDADRRHILVKTLFDPVNEITMVDHLNTCLSRDRMGELLCGARVLWRVKGRQPKSASMIKPRHFWAVALEYAGDTFHSRVRHMTRAARLAVLCRVCQICKTLMTVASVVYTDLKGSNACLVDDNPATIKLIDYGSMALIDTNDGVATYPPPSCPFGVDVTGGEATQAYVLATFVIISLNPAKSVEYPLRFRDASKNSAEQATRSLHDAVEKTLAKFADAEPGLHAAVAECLRERGTVELLLEALKSESEKCT